jgi:uroporphyrinogen-III synthase
MPDFHGARIGLLEARLSEDTANLVRRMGGEPICAPALREVAHPIPDLCRGFVARLSSATDPIVICLTGAGVRALFAQAAEQGCEDALQAALAGATTVCRGPKPAGVLASRRLPVSIRANDPFTTTEVIAAIEPLNLSGRSVGLVHYGERNVVLADWLRTRGADVQELLPYEWQLPEDTGPIERLTDEVIAGKIDALVFTSQVQVEHLLRIAGARTPSLVAAMNTKTLTGAIGPTCAATLERVGVPPAVVASPPKLTPLLNAVAEALEQRRNAEKAEG